MDSGMLTNWILSQLLRKIVVPSTYHKRVEAIREFLEDDVTGLVGSLTGFAVNSASVDFRIETDNDNLTDKLSNWLETVNIGFGGQIPTGIKELSKEYFKERWQASSFPILKLHKWERVGDLVLPTQMYILDGESVYAKDIENDDDKLSLIGYEYYLGDNLEEKNKLKSTKNHDYIITKPFGRWHDKYPNPYLIKNGVYHNYKIIDSLKRKETEVLDQILPYLMLIKQGSPELFKQGKTLSESDLQNIIDQMQDLYDEMKATQVNDKQIKAPIRASNFTEEISHLIPDLRTIFAEELFTVAEKNILSALGFLDIAEAVSSIDKKEKVLVKYNNKIENIVVEELDKKIKKGDSLQVPTYEKGEAKWKNAEIWKHPYKGKMYRIFTDEGRDFVETTANHSIMVWNNGRLESRRADNLKEGDNLLVLDKFENNNNYQNIVYYDRLGSNKIKKVRNRKSIKIDEEVGYMLGFYLAEGCTTKYTVNLSNTNKEEIYKIKKIVESKFEKKPYIYKCKTECERYKRVYDFRIHSISLANWFKSNFNTGASNKEIPKVIFNSPNSVKQEFLNGYLAGDGHLLKKDKIWISTTSSKKLAKDLMLLSKMIGYNPYLGIRHFKNSKWNTSYRIRYTKNNNRIPSNIIPSRRFSNSGYLENGKELKDFFNTLPKDWIIKKVYEIQTYEYSDMVYDLEVEDNPTFVAGTGVLVHNSNRKESILNPTVFIEETKAGIKDFQHLLQEIWVRIKQRNPDNIKYMNSKAIITHSPMTSLMDNELKNFIRQQYEKGNLSRRTAVEVLGQNFEAEVMRIEKENREGLSYTCYPPVIQNQEQFPDTPKREKRDTNDNEIPEDKLDPNEQKNKYINAKLVRSECPYCNEVVEYDENLEKSELGYATCLDCGQEIFAKDLAKRRTTRKKNPVYLETAPYTNLKELPSNVKKKLSIRKQRQWLAVFNSIYDRILKKTGNKKQAESRAFAGAWSAVK